MSFASSSRQENAMATSSKFDDDSKVNALHVEKISSSSLDRGSEHLEDLDSIEQTQSGRYAWLVAITAGVGGLLFGKFISLTCNK
jgi:SP family myo-inositol transporter-like MFS transporter 13